MKKCQKALLTLLPSFFALAIAIPTASSFAPTFDEVGEDTAIYDSDLKHAKLGAPDISNEVRDDDEEEEVTVEVDKVILHYYNEAGGCDNRAFYIWATGVDGMEYSDDAAYEQNVPSAVSYSADGTSMTLTMDFINDERFQFLQNRSGLWFIIKFKRQGTNLNWGGQSDDMFLRFEDFESAIKDKVCEVWTMPAAGGGIAILDMEEKTRVPGIKLATFTDWKTISCEVSQESSKIWWKLYAFDETYFRIKPKKRDAAKAKYLVKEETNQIVPANKKFNITFKYEAHPNIVYSLESHDPASDSTPGMDVLNKVATVGFTTLYDSAKFHQYYEYEYGSNKSQNAYFDNLGMTYTSTATTFKVWAPMSANITLMLYNTDTSAEYGGSDKYNGYHMHYTKGGIWQLTVDGDLKGMYYNYQVDNTIGTNLAMDPYATSAGACGVRGYIYDKDAAEAKPEGWDTLPVKWDGVSGLDITTPQELSVYEVHMQDFTGDSSWNGNEKPGTYNAFVEKGTHLAGHNDISTGYDHLNELGIKAVQILPMFDSDNDEREDKMKYNWGYNPLNYNVVEGGYSSDAHDGLARVKEFRNLVLEMSKTEVKTRVIMDVVYNHVSSATGSSFHKLMPRYYFRYHGNYLDKAQTIPDPSAGELYDGSGCHNEVASERRMMRKFIVDSLCMWARDYKVKGFRFDLMGLLDLKTMNVARQELYAIDPDIYIYGEGWTSIEGYHGEGTEAYDLSHPTEPATVDKGNYSCSTWQVYHDCNNFDAGNYCYLGCFSDFFRNSLRGGNDPGWGSTSHLPGSGLIQAHTSWDDYDSDGSGRYGMKTWGVAQGMWGINNDQQGFFPEQTVNYGSCHDNWTVRDQLYNTMNEGSPATAEQLLRGSIQAHAITFASNCTAFMLGGEELLRTKELTQADIDSPTVTEDSYEYMHGHAISHNSYNASIGCNSFKWGNKLEIVVDDTKVTNAVYQYNDVFKAIVRMHDKSNYAFKRGSSTARTYDTFLRETTAGHYVENVTWGGTSDNHQGYAMQANEIFVYCSVNSTTSGNAWVDANCKEGGQWVKLFNYGASGIYDQQGGGTIISFDNANSIAIYYSKGIRS